MSQYRNAEDIMRQYREERKTKILSRLMWVPAGFFTVLTIGGLAGLGLATLDQSAVDSDYTTQKKEQEERITTAKETYNKTYQNTLKEGLGVDYHLYTDGNEILRNFVLEASGATNEKVHGKTMADLEVKKGVDVEGIKTQLGTGQWAHSKTQVTEQTGETVTFITRFSLGKDADNIEKRGYIRTRIAEGKTLEAISIDFSDVESVNFPRDGIPEGYAPKDTKEQDTDG